MARGSVGATGNGARLTMATTVATDLLEALRDRVRDAADRRASLRVVGRGKWLDAGRPIATNPATESISTRELAGITEYVPGDLTLTARAGTTLEEIRSATAEHDQWLALDPYGSNEGTLGATIATASAGPLSTSFGTPRDLMLGLEFVTGEGIVVRGGGRVVKNVAGFDLTRLLTGSWGTLGVITEATVRLHARPEADESIVVPLDDTAGVSRARELLRRLPFSPYAFEIINASLARRLVAMDGAVAVIRLGGNRLGVNAQRAAFETLGSVSPIDGDVWRRLRTSEGDGSMVFRLSARPRDIGSVWGAASNMAEECPGAMLVATPARGIVRCIVPRTAHCISVVQRVWGQQESGITRVGERLPGELWSLCSGNPTQDRISAGIKRTFDPHGVLNRGIFGDGS
jgi:glycolate oxidase FAD binding subunit